jgi:hypothetical protein
VTDQIDTVTGTARIPYQRISYPSISSSDELLFTYDVLNIGLGTFEVHAIRAIAADAPTWSNEIPAGPIQSWASNRGNAFKGTITLSGLDYIFYSKPPVGLNQTFAYITSPSSLGSTWGAEQQIGTVPLLNVASGAQPAAFNPSWALTLYYDATGALVSGEGYFEAAAAPTKRCLQ